MQYAKGYTYLETESVKYNLQCEQQHIHYNVKYGILFTKVF